MPDEQKPRPPMGQRPYEMDGFRIGDLDGMAAEEREQAEYERDSLVYLGSRAEIRRADSSFYEDDRFIEWLGTQVRAMRPFSHPREDREDDEMARRIWERITVHWIAPAGPVPVAEPALVPSPMTRAIDEASRHGCAPQWDFAVAAGAGRTLWDEPCDGWVKLPEATHSGRYVALRVAGESMAPAIHSDDMILVRLGSELVRGAIVVARVDDDGYVVKRVGRSIGLHDIEMESLNPDYDPITMPYDPSRVLGTVVMRWCDHHLQPAESV